MNPIFPPLPTTGLSPLALFTTIILYFFLLLGMAWWANRRSKSSNDNFFSADNKSPWFLIAFGTVGGSLSGVTFVSVPGAVSAGAANQQFSYWQLVLGMVVGYWIVAAVLLPIYYRLQLVSIYGYLRGRFGEYTYKTGASFFVLSRSIGTAFRLFLTVMVLHSFIFASFGIPFWVSVLTILTLIFIYTYKGGIQTIVWTDAIQTIFMLASVFFAVYLLCRETNIDFLDLYTRIDEANLGQIFFFDNGWEDPNNFFKQFFAGISVAIVMTGLDQDMMQKNLTCYTLRDAQKNLVFFSFAVMGMTFVFLTLGALLSIYANQLGLTLEADKLFPTLALEHFPPIGSLFFIIGLTAAAYASTDSALTALTTSFCVDILGMKTHNNSPALPAVAAQTDATLLDDLPNKPNINQLDINDYPLSDAENAAQTTLRRWVHVGFVGLVFVQILAFWFIDNRSIINSLLTLAGYTYGPLLGLYAFGIFTKRKVLDQLVPLICIASPIVTYLLSMYSKVLFWGYVFSFELLIINGLLTFLGLLAISTAAKNASINASRNL
jgi:Na+/proline symporter